MHMYIQLLNNKILKNKVLLLTTLAIYFYFIEYISKIRINCKEKRKKIMFQITEILKIVKDWWTDIDNNFNSFMKFSLL